MESFKGPTLVLNLKVVTFDTRKLGIYYINNTQYYLLYNVMEQLEKMTLTQMLSHTIDIKFDLRNTIMEKY